MPADVSLRSESPRAGSRTPYHLFCLFGLLAIGICVVSYYFYEAQRAAVLREFRGELLTLADMKSRQIAEWRAERIGTARSILESPITLAALERIVKGNSNAAETSQVREWMNAICRNERFFNAILVDRRGRALLQ